MQDGNPSHVDVAAHVGELAMFEDVLPEIAMVGLPVSKQSHMQPCSLANGLKPTPYPTQPIAN